MSSSTVADGLVCARCFRKITRDPESCAAGYATCKAEFAASVIPDFDPATFDEHDDTTWPKICYKCCAETDQDEMDRVGVWHGYLSLKRCKRCLSMPVRPRGTQATSNDYWKFRPIWCSDCEAFLVNWPATLKLKCFGVRFSDTNWYHTKRWDAWFHDRHGRTWWVMMKTGGFNEVAYCRRLKDKKYDI